MNDMRRLNENGLIKALPLIEEVLGISGKLRVDGDNLLLDGFRLSIDIPDNWVISEDIGVTADGPVGSNPDPSGYWDYLWCDKNVWDCLCKLEDEKINNENQVVYKSVGILRHYSID